MPAGDCRVVPERIRADDDRASRAAERSASAALFSHAQQLAKQLGFSVGECLAGGGSDGNFTAALGVPTLDGLGALGEGAHSTDEQVILSALPQRAALLAGLLATL